MGVEQHFNIVFRFGVQILYASIVAYIFDVWILYASIGAYRFDVWIQYVAIGAYIFGVRIMYASIVAYRFGVWILYAAIRAYIFGVRILYASVGAYIFGVRILYAAIRAYRFDIWIRYAAIGAYIFGKRNLYAPIGERFSWKRNGLSAVEGAQFLFNPELHLEGLESPSWCNDEFRWRGGCKSFEIDVFSEKRDESGCKFDVIVDAHCKKVFGMSCILFGHRCSLQYLKLMQLNSIYGKSVDDICFGKDIFLCFAWEAKD